MRIILARLARFELFTQRFRTTIGAMLGHAGKTVTSHYVHHLDSVLVAAADKAAREIYAQMTGAEAP